MSRTGLSRCAGTPADGPMVSSRYLDRAYQSEPHAISEDSDARLVLWTSQTNPHHGDIKILWEPCLKRHILPSKPIPTSFARPYCILTLPIDLGHQPEHLRSPIPDKLRGSARTTSHCCLPRRTAYLSPSLSPTLRHIDAPKADGSGGCCQDRPPGDSTPDVPPSPTRPPRAGTPIRGHPQFWNGLPVWCPLLARAQCHFGPDSATKYGVLPRPPRRRRDGCPEQDA